MRKGPKLQPIAPTSQFTSHCSVITPKETDDLEKQFDQSQVSVTCRASANVHELLDCLDIPVRLRRSRGSQTASSLFALCDREPHSRWYEHQPSSLSRIPFVVVVAGTQWPTSFDELDTPPDILETDALRVIAQSDDPLLQNKLKENVALAEAATRALEHIYEEDPLPPPPPAVTTIDQVSSPIVNADTAGDTASVPHVNGSGLSLSPGPLVDNLSSTSPPPGTLTTTSNNEASPNAAAPPPPPPSSAALPTAKTPASSVATTLPLAHSAAAVQAAYRQQTSLLGALPGAGALRTASGAMYANSAGLANGLTGQILYGGKKRTHDFANPPPRITSGIPMDALRGYQAGGTSPYVIAAHAGQTMQQPALYAAQLQAVAQQQQAVQYAAAAQQQQQQQQMSLMNGMQGGYMVVRTANGGYAIVGQSPGASAASLQQQAQNQLAQQQYIAYNAANASAANSGRVPMAMVGGQQQQIVYQYAGQPTIQSAPTQYIQLPANYAQQQQQQLSASPVIQATSSVNSQGESIFHRRPRHRESL